MLDPDKREAAKQYLLEMDYQLASNESNFSLGSKMSQMIFGDILAELGLSSTYHVATDSMRIVDSELLDKREALIRQFGGWERLNKEGSKNLSPEIKLQLQELDRQMFPIDSLFYDGISRLRRA